jgi:2-polyprenyl-6-methoxyphenol hydroxylase-like FAD-dependent oxidoreductase
MESLSTTCVVAGGGPAGMMLGLLLARAGVDVTVLEKHRDFLRDFRGDTVHPSTLRIMDELGLLAEFLALPHARVFQAGVDIGGRHYSFADLSRLPEPCNFIAMMPQWDFLDFLARKARTYPNFRLLMETEAKDLLAKGDRIVGVLATGPRSAGGSQSDQNKVNLQIRAGLTIAADGRHSALRAKSGLKLKELGAPFDVLWLRLPRLPGEPEDVAGKLAAGQMFVMIPRGDYWQCALVIAKGGFDAIRAEGITAFRQRLRAATGFADGRIDDAIHDFAQVKLLTVAVNRLMEWARPGLLCIGDAAHAMSPVGGVGINLAIQDAVAAANILAPILRKGVPKLGELNRVQKRREFPTRVVQAFQIAIQNRFLAPTIRATRPIKAPLLLRLLDRCAYLRQFPARFIGLGVRPEHVNPEKR